MNLPANDDRSQTRRELDELIASEAPLPPPSLTEGAIPIPVEHYLKAPRRPFAVAGVVEKGLVRPLDPDVHLPEHARVIIVAAEAP
jgi:hypothetical protein